MQNLRFNLLAIFLLFQILPTLGQSSTTNDSGIMKDTNGNPINAHGGGVLYHKGTYYWYGEIKSGKTVKNSNADNYRVNAGGVSCYSSKDLKYWKNESIALAPNQKDTSSDLHISKIIERPKVIYNKFTKKFVMWMHIDSQDYSYARTGVAVSDSPVGPFKYLGSVRPNGNMARDMTLFVDDDGKAYQFYSSEDNETMHICLLSKDYLSHTNIDKRILIGQKREAPAVFKHNSKYYLITSGCSGWAPNAADYATSNHILGDWKAYGNPCKGKDADITYHAQGTFVLPVIGKDNKFIFIADQWNPSDLASSKYLWLPLTFDESGGLIIRQDQQKHTFTLGDNSFLLDGKPLQIISGEIHYPRVPREAWRARMKMAKAMGLNTIGTYVFWNLHEPQKGKFDFSGNNDVAEFVKIAKEEGLWVVLRPSPYVCAEWEFGGFPYWLSKETGLIVRSKEEKYLKEYEIYIKEVGKHLAPLQVNHGGNILMVQIENEYGSYGNDKEYLEINQRLFKEAGFDGLLYTCDPPESIAAGHLPGLLPAVNLIDEPAKVRKLIRENHGGKGPFYVAEWYPAWFDWWGTAHHTVPAEKYTKGLDSVLSAGMSINMYMFHGGTTRGFMNGANYNDHNPYEPQISSYDYDAPLNEAGNPTPKFMAFRNVIEKYLPAGTTLPKVPVAKPAISIKSIALTKSALLLDNLPKPIANNKPLTFEKLNQDYGFVLYRTFVEGNKIGTLKLKELRDYAVIMVNGKTVGTLDRRLKQDSLKISLPQGKVKLEILVENLGRINFGKYLLQNDKGITESVSFNNHDLTSWQMFSLPFETSKAIKFQQKTKKIPQSPVLKKGTFQITKTGDTYLDMQKWGKGVVWINGHNIGRYWSIGPQQTLFVPGEWLKKGENEIIVLELLKPHVSVLSTIPKPILNILQ